MESKIVVNCPNLSCNRPFRVPSDKSIKATCPQCNSLVFIKKGQIQSFIAPNPEEVARFNETAEPEVLERPLWQQKKFQLSALGLFLGMVYFMSPLERSTYQQALERKNLGAVNTYLEKYPKGKYLQTILDIKDQLVLDSVKFYSEKLQCPKAIYYAQEVQKQGKYGSLVDSLVEQCEVNNIKLHRNFADIEAFLAKYPNSTSKSIVDSLYQMVWQSLFKTYEAKVKNSSAKVFFRTVLNNAKQSKNYQIGVCFKSVLALKDWADYSVEARESIDAQYKFLAAQAREKGDISFPPPGSTPMPSIKKVFTEKNQRDMEEKIVVSLTNQLENLFEKRLFELVLVDTTQRATLNSPTTIGLEYDVKSSSQSIGTIELPNIYISKQIDLNTQKERFMGYVLGVGIKWKMAMQTDHQKESFKLRHESEAQESYKQNLKNESMEDIYNLMVRDNFTHFAQYIGSHFGWIVQEDKVPATPVRQPQRKNYAPPSYPPERKEPVLPFKYF